jgi:UPF0716 protein FxsA
VLLLVIAFIVVPIVELYVIIQVGGAIGIGPTIFLLLVDSLLGAFLLRHQGRAAWVAFNRAVAESRVPAKEVLDGVLIIFGGALLLTPGFITDIFGIVLLIPPTRAMVRTFLKWVGISRLSMGPKAALWGASRVNKRRGRPAPGPGVANGAREGRQQARPAPEDFSWETPSSRPADIEGTAQEVRDDDEALPPGGSRSFPG